MTSRNPTPHAPPRPASLVVGQRRPSTFDRGIDGISIGSALGVTACRHPATGRCRSSELAELTIAVCHDGALSDHVIIMSVEPRP